MPALSLGHAGKIQNVAFGICWKLLLEATAGSYCWKLLLEATAGSYCWKLLEAIKLIKLIFHYIRRRAHG
jgi:hypothetical protein